MMGFDDYYEYNLFKAFTKAFIRTGIFYVITVYVYRSINRSNLFFAIFLPTLLFFMSSVFRYCYVPNSSTPYVYNRAFLYSGISLLLFNVFVHNSKIGELSSIGIPGSIVVIVPCMVVFTVLYFALMKLDVKLHSRIRSSVKAALGRIFNKKN